MNIVVLHFFYFFFKFRLPKTFVCCVYVCVCVVICQEWSLFLGRTGIHQLKIDEEQMGREKPLIEALADSDHFFLRLRLCISKSLYYLNNST